MMNKATSIDTIMTVPSIEETADWYKRILGWEAGYDVFDADGQCNFGGVDGSGEGAANEGKFVGFCLIRYQGDPAAYSKEHSGITFLVYVDNVDALYRRAVENGWPTAGEPKNQFWGSRTLDLVDLNGFRLRLATRIEQVSIDEVRDRYEYIR